jgi:hypothetical protein
MLKPIKSKWDICRVNWSDLKPTCTSIRQNQLSLTKLKKIIGKGKIAF